MLVSGTICAESAFAQAATAVDVANARNHINKGNNLLVHSQFQAALVEYQQALDCEPANPVAKANIVLVHNNWGIQYFHQHKYDEARDEWNESLKLSPNDRNAKNNLAILKTTLAKLGPAPTKTSTSPGGASLTDGHTGESDPASAIKSADVAKAPGAQAGQEDNRGVVILSQPASGASIVPASNTDAAAISTSPAAAAASVEATTSAATTGSASSTSANATRPNNTIYNNAMNANANSSNSPFTANPLQSAVSPKNDGVANNDFMSNTQATSPSVPAPAPATHNQPTVSTQPAFATAPVASINTIEMTLGEIETKVYGSTRKDLPIMQRLEKLEQDTNSKVGTGGIADRVQALAKSYGI